LLLEEAMQAGAFGLSTGLIYAPQVYAKTDEIIELAKIVAKYNGLYFSHIRSEGYDIVNAVKELIEIVEKSGCIGGHIAHHKISGRKYWGTSKETLSVIEEANERGLSITFDQYPYTRGMTGLVATLPSWAQEGGPEKILERLKDSKERERIKNDVLNSDINWENWIREVGFENIFVTYAGSEKWKGIDGKSITEITKMKGMIDEWETYFELLIDENIVVQITIEGMGEEDIRRIMKNRYQMVGTDGLGVPLLKDKQISHPRFYGVYPRVISKYVKEEKILTLEEAIRKMTSFPAQRLGIKDRGVLIEGTWADVVIFDYNRIRDKATYEEPNQFCEGIKYVMVNGKMVVENEKQKIKSPGKVIRQPY
ncbi:MAG: amidohydrolase family protein, partial [Candidatus Hermodarchaeota archaeon]